MKGAHELSLGIEGQLPHPGRADRQGVFRQPQAGCILYQGALGGLALGFSVCAQLGVGAQGQRAGQRFFGAIMLAHLHLVLGQGAGLVAAHHLGAPQGFHRGQAADHRPLAAHFGHPYRQHDGDHRGQPFRDRGHRKAHRYHKGGQHGGQIHRARLPQPKAKNKHADGQHQRAQRLAQGHQLLLQGRFSLHRSCQHPGNPAHLGVHAGGGDQQLAPAVAHGAAHIRHAVPVAQRRRAPTRQGGLAFFHRQALAGQGGLLDLQRHRLQQAAVGGHRVPRLQQHHIAGHQILAVNGLNMAAPHHPALGRGHFLQRLDRLFSLALLVYPQQGIDQHHRQNDEHVRKAFARAGGRQARHRGRRQQHNDHGVGHLLQKALEPALLFALFQFVLPLPCQPGGGLAGGEALRPAAQGLLHLAGALLIIFHGMRYLLHSRLVLLAYIWRGPGF